MKTTFPFTIGFGHCDVAGWLFYARIFELAHSAYEAWVEELGFELQEWFDDSGWSLPIRHSHAEYLAPMRHGLKGEIAIKVKSLGKHSFVLGYVFSGGDDKIWAELETVHVAIDRKHFKKTALPEKVRSRLQRLS